MMKDNPPVVTIGYARYQTLQQSLMRLSECHGVEERDCLLFLDAPYRDADKDACNRMLDVAASMKKGSLSHLQIIRRERNYGVPNNLIAAITNVIERYGSVIFFEDDVLVSRTFLRYMDEALERYEQDNRIFCINGYKSPYLGVPKSYMNDVYLNPRNMAWGFGIWKDRWCKVDFGMEDWKEFSSENMNMQRLNRAGCDIKGLIEAQLSGGIHTWDVQCTYYMVKNNMYAVEPRYSLTKNIGFGQNGGVHCHSGDPVLVKQRFYNFLPILPTNLDVDLSIECQFKNSVQNNELLWRILRKARRLAAKLESFHNEPMEIVK